MRVVWWIVFIMEICLWGFGWAIILSAPLFILAILSVLWAGLGMLVAVALWEIREDEGL